MVDLRIDGYTVNIPEGLRKVSVTRPRKIRDPLRDVTEIGFPGQVGYDGGGDGYHHRHPSFFHPSTSPNCDFTLPSRHWKFFPFYPACRLTLCQRSSPPPHPLPQHYINPQGPSSLNLSTSLSTPTSFLTTKKNS